MANAPSSNGKTADFESANRGSSPRGASNPRDILRRNALRYHMMEDRSSSCGSMEIDLDLIFSGFVVIGEDARLHITPAGLAFLERNRVSAKQIAVELAKRDSDTRPKDGDAKQGSTRE